MSTECTCRVCGSATASFFQKQLAQKYQVNFYQCPDCGHVQTEAPYWLEEVYANLNFASDTGMVSRSIGMGQMTVALAGRLGIDGEVPCLDFGAGTGMTVRLCRDYGMNSFYYDRYASNIFALGFEASRLPAGTRPRLVTAFEVAEHFPDPLANFQEIFAFEPEYVFISTSLYTGQGPDWWYFVDNGQHVAFYTEESLRRVAQHFGYQVVSDYDIHLFSRQPIPKNLLKKIRRNTPKQCKSYCKRNGSRTVADSDYACKLLAKSEA